MDVTGGFQTLALMSVPEGNSYCCFVEGNITRFENKTYPRKQK